MVYAHTRICPWKRDTYSSPGRWDIVESVNPLQKTRAVFNYQEEKNMLSSYQRVKGLTNILKLQKSRKKLLNMKMISIVIIAFETIPKNLEETG